MRRWAPSASARGFPRLAVIPKVPFDPEPRGFLVLVQCGVLGLDGVHQARVGEPASQRPPRTGERSAIYAGVSQCPRLLPRDFPGASAILIRFDALAAGPETPSTVCIAGTAGVGKTALALIAADRTYRADLFATAIFVDPLGYHDMPLISPMSSASCYGDRFGCRSGWVERG